MRWSRERSLGRTLTLPSDDAYTIDPPILDDDDDDDDADEDDEDDEDDRDRNIRAR